MSGRWFAYTRQGVVTAIAAVASFYVATFFALPDPYWSVISSMIVMQSRVGATVGASWNRLAGTAIGALVGVVFGTFLGTELWAFAVAVIVTVWLCASLGLLESYRLAGVTVAIVMLISRGDFFWMVGIRRFLEVGVGIVVSLVITGLTWPSRARRHLRNGIAEALFDMDALYLAIVSRYRGGEGEPIEEIRARLHDSMKRHAALLKEAIYEPAMGASPALLSLWGEHLERLLLALEALALVVHDGGDRVDDGRFDPELGQLIDAISSSFRELGTSVAAGRLREPHAHLGETVLALDEKVSEVSRGGRSFGFGFDEALRFYAFLAGLRVLAREIDLVETSEATEVARELE